MPERSRRSQEARGLTSQVVYRGPVFWVTTDYVIEPGGVRVRRDVVRHSGSVVILAVDEHRSHPHVLLERQYRHAAGSYLWELPAGRIDKGENALAAAKRELLEETGLKAGQWTEIQRMHLSNSVSDELSIIYLARDLTQFEAEPEDTEQLIIKKIPFSEMYSMVCNGEITDSMTVAAVLKVQLLLLENRL